MMTSRPTEQIKRLNFIYPYPDIDKAMANFPNGNVEGRVLPLRRHLPPAGDGAAGHAFAEARMPDRLDSKGSTGSATGERSRTRSSAVPRRSSHLSKHVVEEIWTPADPARDTGNSEGAFAGWAFIPELTRAPEAAPASSASTCAATGRRRPRASVGGVRLQLAGIVVADRQNCRRRPGLQPGAGNRPFTQFGTKRWIRACTC
jgi:hypothetical protein